MFTHGTITGLLFLLVGLIHEKAHTRHIPDLSGLASRMPLIATALLVAGLASLGLPGLSGFVAEILVFLGTFPVWGWATALGAFGIVLTAGYILWMLQRTLFGPARERFDSTKDATLLEAVPIIALMISIVAVGLWPSLLTRVFDDALIPLVNIRFGLL
jgi:NADH-quinone oxidoreductase subunit M